MLQKQNNEKDPKFSSKNSFFVSIIIYEKFGGAILETVITQKIEIIIEKKDIIEIDYRSKVCIWLYNYMLDFCKLDYKKKKSNSICVEDKYFLKNSIAPLKKKYQFLREVYSGVLLNVVYRLRRSLLTIPKYKRFDSPTYLDFKNTWFSLYYGGNEIGYKIIDNKLRISLSANKRIYAKLTQKIGSKDLLNLRIIKQYGRYFALFQYKRQFVNIMNMRDIKNWVAIDQNHENFFHAIDSYGGTYRFDKIIQEEYFNKVLFKVYEKRDKCKIIDKDGKITFPDSNRVRELNKTIDRVCNKRHEQTMAALGTIVKWITDKYDLIVIGDYLPTKETIPFDNMKLAMLHRSHIGKFRSMLQWSAKCKGKHCIVVNEENTTKVCCLCGNSEYRNPKKRSFECKTTGVHVIRDLNSCVNIARKSGIVVHNLAVDKVKYEVIYDFKQNRIRRIN